MAISCKSLSASAQASRRPKLVPPAPQNKSAAMICFDFRVDIAPFAFKSPLLRFPILLVDQRLIFRLRQSWLYREPFLLLLLLLCFMALTGTFCEGCEGCVKDVFWNPSRASICID